MNDLAPSPISSLAVAVEVRYCAQAAIIAGTRCESAELSNDQTLDDLLLQLGVRHAALRDLLFELSDPSASSVLIFVNDRQVDRARPPILKDRDKVIILTPMAGG